MNQPDKFAALREEIPVCRLAAYMDAAYDCGGSLFARRGAEKYYSDWAQAAAAGERGGPGRETFFRAADETRELIAALVGGSSGREVAFTRNTNEGISHVLMGFEDFRPGDNVVTLSIEHPSVLMPCLNLERLRGVECRLVEPRGGEYPDVSLIEDACDSRTRIIALSHVQSSNGVKCCLRDLGAFCRSRGIFLLVDAIQSLGFQPFHAREWGVSAVSAGGYKGLLAGESSAFLWLEPELARRVWPVYTAAGPAMSVVRDGSGARLSCSDPSWARKFENSSLDAPGIYALREGVKRVMELTPEAIADHISPLYERLWDGLNDLGLEIVTPREEPGRCASVCFRARDMASFAEKMRRAGVVMTASRLLRLSLASFSNDEDVDRTLEAAREAV